MDNADFLTRIRTANTFLFSPASRPEMVRKALNKVSSPVIIDLEDAVALDEKQQARHYLDELLPHAATTHGGTIVRVNAPTDEQFLLDMESISNILEGNEQLRAGTVVMLAKAESAWSVDEVRRHLPGTPVLPLIESALGVINAVELAASDGVLRLALGALDLAAETGTDPESATIDHARTSMVLASAAAGLPGPVDSPRPEFGELEAVSTAARHARSLGFRGILCIHPAQIDPARDAFAPTEEEISWAHSVIGAADGASSVDGAMVDRPVLLRAQEILSSER